MRMIYKGFEFFDQDIFFDTYMAHREWADNPNETLEKPIILELLQDVRDKRILDLGCGDGIFASELFKLGCKEYTGLEASSKMVAEAKHALKGTSASIVHATIEDWEYPSGEFDLVTSRLALHYVEDLEQVFLNVHRGLVPGGTFVFSVLHPVITASIKSAEKGGKREDWIVDDYFIDGPRIVPWIGGQIIQYHRTVEDFFYLLQNNGFLVEHLKESHPVATRFTDKELLGRRHRIPLFLILAGRKP